MAASHNPKDEFAQFKECLLNRVTITDRVFLVSGDGAFRLKKWPEVIFFRAESPEALSKTPQPVPGGLRGIKEPIWWPKPVQDWFNKKSEEGQDGEDHETLW